MTDLINALVLLSNFVLIPAITYGSQLALGALGITLIYGILRFANFAYGDLMALQQHSRFYSHGISNLLELALVFYQPHF